MKEIYQHGQAADLSILAPVKMQKQGEQKYHHQRQEQVHTVVTLNVQTMEPEGFPYHTCKGGQQPQERDSSRKLPSRRPQQQKQRHKK